MTRLRTQEFYRSSIDKARGMVKSAIRRAAVLATEGGLWQTEGFSGEQEDEVEVFGIGGVYSRPESDDAEVVIAKIGGGTANGVIIATRDETARQALTQAKDLAAGETIVFNQAGGYVKIFADGAVEIDTPTEIRLAAGSNKLIRGTSFTSAMQVWGAALSTFAAAIPAGPGPGLTAAEVVYQAAHTAFFGTPLSAFLSTKSGTG